MSGVCERIERLRLLANSVGVPRSDAFANLVKLPNPEPSVEDVEVVENALSEIRLSSSDSRKPWYKRSSSSSAICTHGEATEILGRLIKSQNGCSPGQAVKLIRMGADVIPRSNKKWKPSRKQNQEDIHNSIFLYIVEHTNVALITAVADAVAHKSGQVYLNAALKRAFVQRDLAKVQTLLAMGHRSGFMPTGSYSYLNHSTADVTHISTDCTSLITAETATECLLHAIQLRDLQVIRILLTLNADADADNSSAMMYAVAHELLPIVAVLCLARHPPSPGNLAAMLGALCEKHEADSMLNIPLKIVEIMLVAGAHGSEVSQALYNATDRRQYVLVKLLAEYTKPDHEWDSRTLGLAMKQGDLHLFSSLMSKLFRGDVVESLTQDLVDNLIRHLTFECSSVSSEIRLQMMRSLCYLKPSIAVLDEALVNASEHDETNAVEFLVSRGASVNSQSGQAFFAAIANQSIRTFCALLAGQPCPESTLPVVLERTRNLAVSTRLQYVRGILKPGVGVEAVNKALFAAVEDHDGSLNSQKLIDLLVGTGADVNTANGQCFVLASQHSDVMVLKTLLRGSFDALSLQRSFESALEVEDFELKVSLASLVLDAGASGTVVDRALCRTIDGSTQGRRLAELILRRGKPDVDFDDGNAVIRAVEFQDSGLLRLLTSRKPSLNTVGEALLKCIQLLTSDVAQSAQRDMGQIKILLSFEGAIDYGSGKAILAALACSDDELLSILLEARARPETLWKGLDYILDKFKGSDRRFKLAKMFFDNSTTIPGEGLGRLLHKTFSHDGSEELLRVFLDAGASVNIDTLEPFTWAVKQNDHLILRLLLDAGATEAIVARVFDYAWSFEDLIDVDLLKVLTKEEKHCSMIEFDHYLMYAVQNAPKWLPVVEYLLDLDTSVESCGNECLRTAALNFDTKTLSLLLSHTKNRSSVTDVFEVVFSQDAIWSNPSGISIVETLLNHGASGDGVDRSLLMAVERYDTHIYCNAKGIFECLVNYQASSDYKRGMAFETAARQGNPELVKQLFDTGPSASTVANAFPYIFTSPADEQTTLALIKIFTSNSNELHINDCHKRFEPILFHAMKMWPRSAAIIQALLNAGASGDQRLYYGVMYPDQPEFVTPLLWALRQPNQIISHAVITSLIHASDVNFASESSRTSILIAAIQGGRTQIVDLLLEKSADPSPDYQGWTPLCYASLQDDINILKSLLGRAGYPNDGSLHHAVSKCKVEQAFTLLNSGHDPNYLSKWHGSQPATEVLIKHQDKYQDKRHSFQKMKRMFELLHQYGANPSYQSEGKSLLIMALDAHEPENVVSALLEAFMGTMIDFDFNIYHADHADRTDAAVYSPLSYVIHDRQASGNWYRTELSNILRAFGCGEIYYHKTGRQPPDFVGAPEAIQEKERQRVQREELSAEEEERHQTKLRRDRELDQAELERKNEAHAAEKKRRLEADAERQLAAQQDHNQRIEREKQAAEAEKRKIKYAKMANDETERRLELKRISEHLYRVRCRRPNTEQPLVTSVHTGYSEQDSMRGETANKISSLQHTHKGPRTADWTLNERTEMIEWRDNKKVPMVTTYEVEEAD